MLPFLKCNKYTAVTWGGRTDRAECSDRTADSLGLQSEGKRQLLAGSASSEGIYCCIEDDRVRAAKLSLASYSAAV